MKKMVLIVLFVVLMSMSVLAHTGHDEHSSFEQAEAIINAKISCDSLSDEQLETLGDYYMEQIHPGEAHEVMDEMMGGEGSESLKAMHINMAKSFYCGENSGMGTEMMNIMMGGTNKNIGMMENSFNYPYARQNYWFESLLFVFVAALIFALVFWFTYKLVVNNKKRK